MAASAGPGRPRQPEIEESALRSVRELIDERGYDAFGMREVAERAGVSLGALYRRWPGKRHLVVAGLRAATHEIEVEPTDDPEEDLLRGLILLADSLTGGARALLAHLLANPGSELSQAIREAKITPFTLSHQQRLRRVIGSPPDFDTRAAIGPALIILRTMTHGHPPSAEEIRDAILPAVLTRDRTRRPPPGDR